MYGGISVERNRIEGRQRALAVAAVWYWSIAAICLVFLIGTFLAEVGESKSFVLQKLMLTRENNPAALWSGLLLALVAVHAYDGYALWRRRQPDVAKAWLCIALLLMALSADEVSSLHELVAILGARYGVGDWIPLLPFAIVLASILGYALLHLWRSETQRGTALLVLAGFGLLGSVAAQEFLEHRIVFESSVARALRAVVEEGTELAGMLLLLRVTMANTTFAQPPGYDRPCLDAVRDLRVPAIVAALFLTPFLAIGTAMYADPNLGRAADWLATVLLFGAALAACRPWLRGEGSPWSAWALAGICGVAAVAIVELDPDKVAWFDGVTANMRLLTLGLLTPVLVAAWCSLHDCRSLSWYLLGAAIVTNLMALAFLPLDAVGIYGVTQLLALAIYVVQTSEAGRLRLGEAEGVGRIDS